MGRVVAFRNTHPFADRTLDRHLHIAELDLRLRALDPFDPYYKEDWLGLVREREEAIRAITDEWTEPTK